MFAPLSVRMAVAAVQPPGGVTVTAVPDLNVTCATMRSFAAIPAGTVRSMLVAPPPFVEAPDAWIAIAGSMTYGSGSDASSSRSSSHHADDERASDQRSP